MIGDCDQNVEPALGRPESMKYDQQARERRREAALQAPRCADAEEPAHQDPEVQSCVVNQNALQNVRTPSEVEPPEMPGLVGMCEGPLQPFTSSSQQPATSIASNASAVAVDGMSSSCLVLPAAPTSGWLRDVASDVEFIQSDQYFVAVITLV